NPGFTGVRVVERLRLLTEASLHVADRLDRVHHGKPSRPGRVNSRQVDREDRHEYVTQPGLVGGEDLRGVRQETYARATRRDLLALCGLPPLLALRVVGAPQHLPARTSDSHRLQQLFETLLLPHADHPREPRTHHRRHLASAGGTRRTYETVGSMSSEGR